MHRRGNPHANQSPELIYFASVLLWHKRCFVLFSRLPSAWLIHTVPAESRASFKGVSLFLNLLSINLATKSPVYVHQLPIRYNAVGEHERAVPRVSLSDLEGDTTAEKATAFIREIQVW